MTNDYANFDLDLRKRTQRRSPTIFNQFLIKAHGRKRTTCKIETVGGKDLKDTKRNTGSGYFFPSTTLITKERSYT